MAPQRPTLKEERRREGDEPNRIGRRDTALTDTCVSCVDPVFSWCRFVSARHSSPAFAVRPSHSAFRCLIVCFVPKACARRDGTSRLADSADEGHGEGGVRSSMVSGRCDPTEEAVRR